MRNHPRPIARRTLLASGAAALACPAIARAQTKTIVTTSYGGAFEDNYRKLVTDPFSRKTGATFVFKRGGADEWLNSATINRDDPEIDLPFLSFPVAMRAIRTNGVFQALSPAKIPHLNDIAPIFYDTYERKAVGFNYVDYGVLYRTDGVAKPIESWADLWEPSLRNKVLCPGPTAGSMYELVMIAARINGSDGDYGAGIEALKRLKPNIYRWFNTANEVDGLLQRNEASVAAGFGGFRSYALIDAGLPARYVIPREGAPMGVLSYHVPVNAKNPELLFEFIDWALAPEQQTAFGNAMPTGVCSTKAQLSPSVASRIAPPDKLLKLDWAKLQANYNDITRRMQREVIS